MCCLQFLSRRLAVRLAQRVKAIVKAAVLMHHRQFMKQEQVAPSQNDREEHQSDRNDEKQQISMQSCTFSSGP